MVSGSLRQIIWLLDQLVSSVSGVSHRIHLRRQSLTVQTAALIVYEHILTGQQEYQVIWKRKLTIPIVLYLLNRYTLLSIGVLYIFWSYLVWVPMDHVSSSYCLVEYHR